MPISEKKRASNKKWDAENIKDNYARINFLTKREAREAIKQRADSLGLGMSDYIKSLIRADMGGIDL
jgi:predicted DNA binding CopG/RHH family protein